MLRVTVDANILHALFKPEYLTHPEVTALWDFHRRGRLDLRAPPHIAVDIPDEPLKSRIQPFPVLPAAPAPAGAGSARKGGREARLFRDLRNLLFPGAVSTNSKEPNRTRDVNHLIAHIQAERDLFLTDDKAILGRKTQLQERFGVTVMHPTELLGLLRQTPDAGPPQA